MGYENTDAANLANNSSLNRIACGDVSALDLLYKNLKRPVFLLAFSILRDYALAEDVMQDTFLKVNEKAVTYNKGTNSKAWVLTIARNLSLNLLKKRSRETLNPDALEQDRSTDAGQEALNAMEFSRTLGQLEEPERTIVTLRIVCGLRHAEIAKIVGLSAGDTRVHYSRALKKLKAYYETI
jgi:RNA polymerase sigma-70 factor (ECF subfamily)